MDARSYMLHAPDRGLIPTVARALCFEVPARPPGAQCLGSAATPSSGHTRTSRLLHGHHNGAGVRQLDHGRGLCACKACLSASFVSASTLPLALRFV